MFRKNVRGNFHRLSGILKLFGREYSKNLEMEKETGYSRTKKVFQFFLLERVTPCY